MKKSLETMLATAESLLARAEEYQDSENEKTADKYADVAAELENVVAAIQGAIESFDVA
jgi:hypothetical protein